MRLAHKYKGLAEQLLLNRDVIRFLSIPALLAWSQHAFVNAATVHGGLPPLPSSGSGVQSSA